MGDDRQPIGRDAAALEDVVVDELGALLRELWSEGQRPTADELLQELTSAEIELEAVAEYVRDSLAAA